MEGRGLQICLALEGHSGIGDIGEPAGRTTLVVHVRASHLNITLYGDIEIRQSLERTLLDCDDVIRRTFPFQFAGNGKGGLSVTILVLIEASDGQLSVSPQPIGQRVIVGRFTIDSLVVENDSHIRSGEGRIYVFRILLVVVDDDSRPRSRMKSVLTAAIVTESVLRNLINTLCEVDSHGLTATAQPLKRATTHIGHVRVDGNGLELVVVVVTKHLEGQVDIVGAIDGNGLHLGTAPVITLYGPVVKTQVTTSVDGDGLEVLRLTYNAMGDMQVPTHDSEVNGGLSCI